MTEEKRVFEGKLKRFECEGWMIENPVSYDDDWFEWVKGKRVRITIEQLGD